eukprot:CAMPEP_0181312380 /NCGR_PEP_ID=MMETSP1101-20121128/13664_1 /TAXON_ID=46948 /ORGANISM="Rhodomonas abbreviata, Strain Caron Lab Isolate" /LENGTH=291 /DNA_ID=CAMNT_0023419223 /DNA_START=47 /DNA_END=922 /DNA_ORIENTATION=+
MTTTACPACLHEEEEIVLPFVADEALLICKQASMRSGPKDTKRKRSRKVHHVHHAHHAQAVNHAHAATRPVAAQQPLIQPLRTKRRRSEDHSTVPRTRGMLEGERIWRIFRRRTAESHVHQYQSIVNGTYGGSPLYPLLSSLRRMPVSRGGLSQYFLSELFRRTMDVAVNRPPASTFAIDNLASMAEDQEGEKCSICQECVGHNEGKSLPCAHGFHSGCIKHWLLQHNSCPLCRCEIESTCPQYNRINKGKLLGLVREEATAPEQSIAASKARIEQILPLIRTTTALLPPM